MNGYDGFVDNPPSATKTNYFRLYQARGIVPRSSSGSCLRKTFECLDQVSKLMLFPNLAYSWTFSCSISSRVVLSFSSTADTDCSIFSVEEASISWTSETGKEMKVSPTLYLHGVRA